jgi:hypothetical protein
MPKEPTMASDKLFGKYDDFVRLLVGFALTGFLGTYLSQTYTTKQANLAAAQKVFSDESAVIGKRYFVMDQIMNAYQDNRATPGTWPEADMSAHWAAYRSALQDWNATRGFTREMIRLYFGNTLWNRERDLHYAFRAWGQALEAEHKHPGSVDFACLDKKVDEILSSMHDFQFQLAAAIQAGNVGPGRDQSQVQENPQPATPCVTGSPH